MTSKKEIHEELINLSKRFESLEERIDSFSHKFRPEPLIEACNSAKTAFNELFTTLKNNLDKLNFMANELKGVVSLSRAALNEGKQFTEILELPRILNHFSENICRSENQINILKEIIGRFSWSGFTEEEHLAITKLIARYRDL